MNTYDVIVIGQGYAGLTAAKLAAARGLSTANFEELCFGGLVLNLNELEPYPEGEEHCGSELASTLAMGNMDRGVASLSDGVTGIEQNGDGTWTVHAGQAYTAKNVIIASGARLRKLGVPGETEYFGQGVSECADCDGPMFMGMETVVVGGGDSAYQEALALTAYATKVTIVMRAGAPRARPDWVERVAANPKITVLPHAQVTAIEGAPGKGVTGVQIAPNDGAPYALACSGVFVYIGLAPSTGYLPAEVAKDERDAVKVGDNGAAGQPGLWAIGAVRSGFGGTLAHARADAEQVVAAL